jgi:diguanylate cyclase (GGDEF)-like protein/PAS domain S-box-containing protein
MDLRHPQTGTAIEQRLAIEHGVTRVLGEFQRPQEAAPVLIETICRTLGWACGAWWGLQDQADSVACVGAWSTSPEVDRFLDREGRKKARGGGLRGRAWESGEPVWVQDLLADPTFRRRDAAAATGLRSAFAFPVTADGAVIGVIEFFSQHIHQPDAALLDCTRYVGSQIGQFCRRAEAQQRLKESEARFQSTIELAAIGIAHIAPDGRFLHVNQWLCDLLGYTREELLARTFKDLTPPEERAVSDANREKLMSGELRSLHREKRYLRKDGSLVWVSLAIAFRHGPDGTPLYSITIVQDISARKQAERALHESQALLEKIIDNIPTGVQVKSAVDYRMLMWNKAAETVWGVPREEVIGRTNHDLWPREDADRMHAADLELIRQGGLQDFPDRRAVTRDRGAIRLHMRKVPLFDAAGVATHILVIADDMTQRLAEERLLRLEHAVTRCLAEADSAAAVLPAVMREICQSEGWACGEYWGRDEKAEVLRFGGFWNAYGPSIQNHFDSAHDVEFAPGVGLAGRVWQSGEPMWIPDVTQDARLLRRDLARDAGLRSAFLFPVAAAGHFLGVFAFWSREIREPDARTLAAIRVIGSQIGQFLRRKQADERVQHLASHDALTGLPNRAMFSQMLNHAIATGQRYERKFSVLFIDLDRFKLINDTLGHDAGDQLLREVSARLKASVRTSDLVARLSGDEFVMLVQETAGAQQARIVARKVLSALLKPVLLRGQECRVTASIGIALYPLHATDEAALMKGADLAMYAAKEEGKNTFQVYSKDLRSKSVAKLSVEAALRQALEGNELSLHYQAKRDLRSGAITGVEALLRWNSAQLGQVSPATFIPVAEETGLIVPIGRWVLRTACLQHAAWIRAGLPPVPMAVNLSPRQFADPNLLADLANVLRESGTQGSMLELEITEGMVMHDAARAVRLLREIKQLGVRVAIDDFGTGYSSLAQLKQFPIDTLKVDRSFIRDIPSNTEDKAITEAIIDMAKRLSLTVVAEGVETAAQEAFLRKHACDQMQGYYFSKPVPAADFADLLGSHSPRAPARPKKKRKKRPT